MDCDCEYGCHKCSNHPEDMRAYSNDYICEECKSWICDCGMDDSIELPPFPG